MNYVFLMKIKGFNFKMNYADIKLIKLGKLIHKLLRGCCAVKNINKYKKRERERERSATFSSKVKKKRMGWALSAGSAENETAQRYEKQMGNGNPITAQNDKSILHTVNRHYIKKILLKIDSQKRERNNNIKIRI